MRRGFVADRYAPLIKALYDGSKEADISTEVTFEDGRKGVLSARVKISDAATYRLRRPWSARREENRHSGAPRSGDAGMQKHGRSYGFRHSFACSLGRNDSGGAMRAPAASDTAATCCSSVENVSLSFGGVRALRDVSFDIRKGEVRAIIGPNGAGKTSMLNVINGFYHPQQGEHHLQGQDAGTTCGPYDAARGGIARTFQNVALFKGMTALDNIMAGPHAEDAARHALAGHCGSGLRSARGDRAPRPRSRRSSTSWRSSPSARCRSAGCPTACRSASSSAARSPWSPSCCCSTSRWPA